jgi:hypothetical protein
MINNIVHITKINTVSEVKLVSLLIFFMIFTLVLMNLGKRYYLQLFFIDKFKLSKSKVKIKGAIFNRKYKGIYVKYIITFFAICLFLFMLVFGNPQVSGMPQGALIFGICSGIFGSFPDMYGPGYFLTRNKENKIQLPSIEVKIVKE